jgi:hypothetical protein
VTSSAASRLRACPPILVNSPPAYSVEPLSNSVCTPLLAAGFHGVTVSAAASNIAILLRRFWPSVSNEPATKIWMAFATMAETVPLE